MFSKGNQINTGRIPWNKGTKGLTKPNTGTFKKGHHKSPLAGIKKGANPNHTFSKGNKINQGKKASIETRWKMSESHKGKRCNFYVDGRSKERFKERKTLMNTFEYKLCRETVFKRDNWTCLFCGLRSGKGRKVILHADHIKPWNLYPELRFAIDNIRTLCAECHYKTDTFGGNSRNYKNIKKQI